MALEFTHGSLQWLTTDVLGSTIGVTNLTFTPKALRVYWFGIQSNPPTNAASQALDINRGVGFAVSGTSRRCIGSYSQDNAGTSNCGAIARNDAVVVTVDGNGTTTGLLDFAAFTANGFNLTVDDVAPVNITIFWEVWGGTDITVAAIGDIAEPAAIGNQTYTVTGFTADGANQVVMFAGTQSTAALNTGAATDSGMCVGFASSINTENNVTLCGNQDDASANADTDGYLRIGECLSMIALAGGNTTARATLNSFGANSFTLNWIARAVTNRRYIYLAIKGGGWRAGGTTINGNTLNATATVGPFPFQPNGISMFTKNEVQNAAGVSTANDRICIGTAQSSTSRNSGGSLDEDAVGTMEVDLVIQYDSVLSVPSAAGAVQAKYDIDNFGFNTVTAIVDVAGGVANTSLGYLAFGNPIRAPRPISIGHPFIV